MKKDAKIVIVAMACVLAVFAGFAGCAEKAGVGVIEPVEGEPWWPMEEEALAPRSKANKGISVTARAERMVIQKASLKLEVEDSSETAEKITEITRAAGGFIADSETWITSTGQGKGKSTIRIPREKFFSTIGKIELLGNVESKEITGEDITEEYIDLESHLRNYQQTEDRLLKILKKAKKVSEIMEVEEALTEVRGEIEEITGRMEYLRNRVNLSTITVSFHEPAPIVPKGGNAFHAAWEGFLSVVNGIIICIGYALPILIIIGVIWGIIIGYKHLYKSKPRLRSKKK
ncbi:MAG TPA: DUF4349 domain-containing protein [Thermoplasmata archaeon]|nr:DUF4349 domain-containing protein [Thermoplasmata archaeon]